jgi:hypothetical protein
MVVGVMDLVPKRPLDPQTLGQPLRRSGATVRLTAALIALAGPGVVVSNGRMNVTSADVPHRGTGGELTR